MADRDETSRFSPRRLSGLRRALATWYDTTHRKLPWRSAPGWLFDAYRVLVSEAMLQQTQVATVVSYYNRFVERFPDVRSLAAADEQDVLNAWQGLGYYRRARHLHRAARMIVEEHGGRVPDSVEGLLKLPGVGRYTAGAVASIAYGVRAPIVDGNVARVLARVEGIEAAIDDAAVKKRLWALAEVYVPAEGPGDFNQAMMELGARVCVPRGPDCGACPIRRYCAAQEMGRENELPVTGKRTAQRPVRHDVVAIERDGKYLFVQRGDGGLWAGMWGLVCREDETGSLGRWVRQTVGLEVGRVKKLGGFEHQTTHLKIAFVVHAARVKSGRLKRGAGVWRALDDVADLPMSRAQQKAIRMVRESLEPGEK